MTDWKKDLKHLYSPSAKEPQIVEVPPMNYLMVDGEGNPEGAAFQEAVQALYSVAYTLKFMLKKDGIEFSVMPLSGLWWMDNMNEFTMEAKDRWKWTAMIGMPDVVTSEHFQKALEEVKKKKGISVEVRFERISEGRVAQVMHVGSYADEPPTIAKLHAYIKENGYSLRGKHHEIYLGDPKRTAPERLKTIIRQPIG